MYKFFLILGAFIVACSPREPTEPAETKPHEIAVKSETDGPKMIAVHAAYCPVCVGMKPLIRELAGRCNAKGVLVDVLNLTEENEDKLLEKYELVGLPTYIFLDSANNEVERLVGKQSEKRLTKALSAVSGRDCKSVRGASIFNEDAEENLHSCRYSNTNATIAKNGSRKLPDPMKKSNARSVDGSQESCSQVSL